MNAPPCERPGCRNPAGRNSGGPCFWHRLQDWRHAKPWRNPERLDRDIESGLSEPPTPAEIAAAKAEILMERMTPNRPRR